MSLSIFADTKNEQKPYRVLVINQLSLGCVGGFSRKPIGLFLCLKFHRLIAMLQFRLGLGKCLRLKDDGYKTATLPLTEPVKGEDAATPERPEAKLDLVASKVWRVNVAPYQLSCKGVSLGRLRLLTTQLNNKYEIQL